MILNSYLLFLNELSFQVCVLAIETAIKYYPAGSVHGYVAFIDVTNPTMGHIFQFQPYVLTNLVHAWQSAYPMRYQKIVIFNAPTVFDVIVKILKSFMTDKIKSRFHVCSHASCFEDIPANILPVEYGGTDGTLQELTGNCGKLNRYKCDAYWTIYKGCFLQRKYCRRKNKLLPVKTSNRLSNNH